MKHTIKLNETELKNIISETVNRVLNEYNGDADGGWFEELRKKYFMLKDYFTKTNNKNALTYLTLHQDDDGIIEDMYSLYCDKM